jgi:hypothetical protein
MFSIRKLIIVTFFVANFAVGIYGQNSVHDDDKLYDQLVTIKGKVEITNHPELGRTAGSHMSLLFQYDECKKCLFVVKTDSDGNYEIGVSRGRYKIILREARGDGAPSFDLLARDQPRYVDATSVLQPNRFDIKVVLPPK